MIATIIIISLAYLWLMYETDWLRVRLPAGSTTWHDELPYEIGYTDNAFMLDEDFPEGVIDMIWGTTDPEYQAWLRQRYEPKLKYGFVDHTVDYPQYEALRENEDLDKRRAGEMIYQRK